MGEAKFDSEVSFKDQEHEAATVICRTEHGNLHGGVYFRADDGVHILHLGSPDHLYLDHWDWPRLWAVPTSEPEQLFHIAATCRLVDKRFRAEKKMPYAIAFGGSSFDREGKLILSSGASGLTCATFILAIFRSAPIELVEEASWPVRKSDDEKFLELLKKFGVSEPNLEVMRKEVESGAKRIWPDEVVGACACALPAKFNDARGAADAIVAKIAAGHVPAPPAPSPAPGQ